LRPLLAAIACLALAAALGGCGGEDEAEDPTTTTASNQPAEVTPLRRELERELRKLIEADAAAADPECVIEELRTTLDNELVEAAVTAAERGEEIPKEAVDAAFEAGEACARG